MGTKRKAARILAEPSPDGASPPPTARLLSALLVTLSAVTVLLVSAWRGGSAGAVGPPSAADARLTGQSRPGPLPSGAPAHTSAEHFDSEGCSFPDRGFGNYEAWRNLPLGRALVRTDSALGADGGFHLLVHFHGAEPVRKQLALDDSELVIVGVDAGTLSSHYARVLSSEGAFASLIASIEHEVARATRHAGAHARSITLSAWSAGYGAVAQVLSRPDAQRLAGIILLDSLHASYAHGAGSLGGAYLSKDRRVDTTALGPFLSFAKQAALGGPFFYLTHSAVGTDGYASTAEVASAVLEEVGAPVHEVTANPEDALKSTRMSDQGRFFLRGYGGRTKEDHCAQLRLLPLIVRDHVLRRAPHPPAPSL